MTPFIVAELSCNHGGSLDRALELVRAAADAGANAVKLQTWTPGTMVSDHAAVMETGPWAGQNLAKLYEEAHTPWHWHKPIFDYAQSRGIEAFSTPFDVGALEFLETLGCPRYKIASFEIIDLDLIKSVAATGKPLIMSTGMATRKEIALATVAAYSQKCRDLTLLKCTSAYPASAEDANLATMQALARGYPWCGVGLSDHTRGIGVAVGAAALGATVIEKHLTLLRADGGPDAAFSMEPDEFEDMVIACRQAAAAIGRVYFGPTIAEMPMVEVRRIRNVR